MSRSIELPALKAKQRWQRLMWRNRLAARRIPIVLGQPAFGIIETILTAANANAQDAKPRAYSNTPVGLNFLIAGYLHAQGKIAFDPTLPISDASFHADTRAHHVQF